SLTNVRYDQTAHCGYYFIDSNEGVCVCQYRLKIPHSSGRNFPTPEPQKGASLASDGAEPSAVFWRVLGEAESEAKEVGAAAPSCPRGGTRPARRRSFSR